MVSDSLRKRSELEVKIKHAKKAFWRALAISMAALIGALIFSSLDGQSKKAGAVSGYELLMGASLLVFLAGLFIAVIARFGYRSMEWDLKYELEIKDRMDELEKEEFAENR